MKIGFFGGTFDPVHLGHIQVAVAVRDELGLDLLLMAPAGEPWLRSGKPVASGEDRLAMVEAAVSGLDAVEASAIDISRPGPTYSLDTVRELRKQYGPRAEIFLIMGLDAAESIAEWHRSDQLLEECLLVVVGRPGQELDFRSARARAAWAGGHGIPEDFVYIEGPMLDIRSTEIRRRLGTGESVDELVPQDVRKIIDARGLYR